MICSLAWGKIVAGCNIRASRHDGGTSRGHARRSMLPLSQTHCEILPGYGVLNHSTIVSLIEGKFTSCHAAMQLETSQADEH